MQDAHHTFCHIHQNNEQEITSALKPDINNSFPGYGIDIFKSRFTPYGKKGFIRAPVLIFSDEPNNQYSLGKTSLKIPACFQFNRIKAFPRFSCNSSGLLFRTEQLGKILDPSKSIHAFHREFSDFFNDGLQTLPDNCYLGLNHFNFPLYSIRLPFLSTERLRRLARNDVISALDNYCLNPGCAIKKSMLFSVFSDYGAFICTGAVYGGFMRQETIYSGNDTTIITQPLERLAEMAYREKSGKSLTLSEQQALDFSDYYKYTRFSLSGGSANGHNPLILSGEKESVASFQQWKESIKRGHNSVFIDFLPGSLVPLWRLAKTKQQETLIEAAFNLWYKNELIKRQLLPDIITGITQIERDKPMSEHDTAGFTHKTGLVSSKNNRYIYLGYNKEPAHRVIQRGGSFISRIYLTPFQQARNPAKNLNNCKVENIRNQYDLPACFSSGTGYQMAENGLTLRKEPLTLDNLASSFQGMYINNTLYETTSLPVAFQIANQGCRRPLISRVLLNEHLCLNCLKT